MISVIEFPNIPENPFQQKKKKKKKSGMVGIQDDFAMMNNTL